MEHKSRHRARRIASEGNLRLRRLHEELARRLRPQPDCPAAGAGASEKRLTLNGHLELDARRESVLPDVRRKRRAREGDRDAGPRGQRRRRHQTKEAHIHGELAVVLGQVSLETKQAVGRGGGTKNRGPVDGVVAEDGGSPTAGRKQGPWATPSLRVGGRA